MKKKKDFKTTGKETRNVNEILGRSGTSFRPIKHQMYKLLNGKMPLTGSQRLNEKKAKWGGLGKENWLVLVLLAGPQYHTRQTRT